MELELGLKISKIVDDFTSTELLIAKDRAGPLFVSRETDNMFILTAFLKGYKREQIKIDINEDGSRIAVSGAKPVQETVMVNWKLYKKEIEMRRFRKAFKIPDGVVLDKIKARFTERESELSIWMPKSIEGVQGKTIEEVKEEEVAKGSSSGSLHITGNGKPDNEYIKESAPSIEKLPGESEELVGGGIEEGSGGGGGSIVAYPEEIPSQEVQDLEKQRTEEKSRETETVESTKTVQDQVIQQKEMPPSPPPSVDKTQGVEEHDQIPPAESKMQEKGLEKHDTAEGIIEPKEERLDQAETSMPKQITDQDHVVQEREEIPKRENDTKGKEEVEEKAGDGEPPGTEKDKSKPREKCSKLCVPMIAGSAFLVSIIVLVIQLIRTKNPSSKKRN